MNTSFKIFSFSLALLASTSLFCMESKSTQEIRVYFEATVTEEGEPTVQFGEKMPVTFILKDINQNVLHKIQVTNENKEILYPCRFFIDKKEHSPLMEGSDFKYEPIEIRKQWDGRWATVLDLHPAIAPLYADVAPDFLARGSRGKQDISINCKGGTLPKGFSETVPKCDYTPCKARLKLIIFFGNRDSLEIFSIPFWINKPALSVIKQEFDFDPTSFKFYRDTTNPVVTNESVPLTFSPNIMPMVILPPQNQQPIIIKPITTNVEDYHTSRVSNKKLAAHGFTHLNEIYTGGTNKGKNFEGDTHEADSIFKRKKKGKGIKVTPTQPKRKWKFKSNDENGDSGYDEKDYDPEAENPDDDE